MTIIRKKGHAPLVEADGKSAVFFSVDYWGVKVTYSARATPNGGVYYRAEDNGEYRAAKALAAKATELFIAAQRKAGINPVLTAADRTTMGFIPSMSDIQ
jgi:hypothetical protein